LVLKVHSGINEIKGEINTRERSWGKYELQGEKGRIMRNETKYT
jgi:hypothetical protein